MVLNKQEPFLAPVVDSLTIRVVVDSRYENFHNVTMNWLRAGGGNSKIRKDLKAERALLQEVLNVVVATPLGEAVLIVTCPPKIESFKSRICSINID
jgi:hypothetical protein